MSRRSRNRRRSTVGENHLSIPRRVPDVQLTRRSTDQHWKGPPCHVALQHILPICFPPHHQTRPLQVCNIHLRTRTQSSFSRRGGGGERGTTGGGVDTQERIVYEEEVLKRRGLEGSATLSILCSDEMSCGRGEKMGRGRKLEGLDDGRWSSGMLLFQNEQKGGPGEKE